MILLAAVALAFVPGFHTPSGNVVCEADSSPNILYCVVFSQSGSSGQKTWSMRLTGRASVRYVKANIATQVPVLAYGHTWSWSGIRCVSRRTGLTCRNRSAHGWTLSRQHQLIF